MRKFIKFLLLTIITVICTVFFLLNAFLKTELQPFITYAVEKTEGKGIILQNALFSSVDYVFPASIILKDFYIDGVVAENDMFVKKERLFVHIEKIIVALESIFNPALLIKIDGLNIIPSSDKIFMLSDREISGARLEIDELKLRVQLSSFNPEYIYHQLMGLAKATVCFLEEGRTALSADLVGTILFTYKNRLSETRLRVLTEKEGNESTLIVYRDDIINLCNIMDAGLRNEEIAVIYRYPMRLLRLIKIRDYARDMARKKHEARRSFPEKAYRHILWSYILTKNYGEKFAEELTTGHEAQADQGEPQDGIEFELNKGMDINNNAIGRFYALSGYTEESIEGRMLKDPEVILYPALSASK